MRCNILAAEKQGERWKLEGGEIGWGVVSIYWEGMQEGEGGCTK